MIYRALSPLILAVLVLLAVSPAAAEDAPRPRRLTLDETADLELLGASEAYLRLAVPLPLSIYADEAKELRRDFLPAAGTRGHSLRQVQARQVDLRRQIAERPASGGANNPHWEADKARRLEIWGKLEAAIVSRLDRLVRTAAKRSEAVLIEGGVRSWATLVDAAIAAQGRLRQRGLLDAAGNPTQPHARIAHRTLDRYAKMAARDQEEAQAPSFNGIWYRKGSSWGVVRLRMTSRTKLTGTWDGGKRGRRLEGVLLDDGITMRLTYWDEGKRQPTKYSCRVAKDGKSISIWSNWWNSDTLERR